MSQLQIAELQGQLARRDERIAELEKELAAIREQKPSFWMYPYGSGFKIHLGPSKPDGVSLCDPYFSAAGAAPAPLATIKSAPGCLNINDKAMWVTGWNECREAMLAASHKEPS